MGIYKSTDDFKLEKEKPLKAGDNLFKSRKQPKRGNKYYESEEYLKDRRDAQTAAESARTALSKVEAGWEMQTTMEDIKQLARLEAALSKKMFNVSVSVSDRAHCNLVQESLEHLELSNIDFYETAEDTLKRINNTNLVLSSYKYQLGKYDGRSLSMGVQNKNFEGDSIIHHCLVSGYTESQAVNLKSANVDTFKYVIDKESPDLIIDSLNSLIRGYYVLHLAEVIFGKQKAFEIRNRTQKLKYGMDTLEKIACKHRFKVLVVEDDKDLAVLNTELIHELGFTNTRTVDSIQTAKNAIETEHFDLIISDYRLGDGSANKIYDHIEAMKFSIRKKPEFVIITGYQSEEVLHLKKYGIRIYDKVDMSNIEIITKGCYVKKIRNLLNDIA